MVECIHYSWQIVFSELIIFMKCFSQILHDKHVGIYGFCNSGFLNFNCNFFTCVQSCFVDLSDGCCCKAFFGKFCKYFINVSVKFTFDYAFDFFITYRWIVILKLFKLGSYFVSHHIRSCT